MRNNYPKLCLLQCCQIFRFHEHSWVCGARVRNSTGAGGRVHWVLAWPAVLEVRSWSWKEKKDDFLQLWDSKGRRSPKPPVWNVRKESLKDAPFPDFCASEAEIDFEIQVLKIPVLSSKTFAPLHPNKALFLCKFAAYLYICWNLWRLVYLFIEFSVSLVLHLGFLRFGFVVVVFGVF